MIKRKIVSLMTVIVMLSIILLSFCMSVTYALDYGMYQVTVSVKYGQTDARNMLKMINDFRTGENAEYYNIDGTTEFSSELRPLVYSYDLEQIAMQRAVEIAMSYSHTRPNGQNYNTYTYHGVRSYCENIAVGYGMNSESAFYSWQGTNEGRNMLDRKYTSVGIAHVTYNGVDYWVQEFGTSQDRCVTNPVDTVVNRNVSIATNRVISMKNTVSVSNIELETGEEIALPTIETTMQIKDGFGGEKKVFMPYYWTVENIRIARIWNNKVVPIRVGTTNLKAMVGNEVITVPVNVIRKTVDNSTITLSENRYAYDGTEKRPDVTVTVRGKVLSPEKYFVIYENNIEIGTANVIVVGTEEYIGKNSITFEIYCPHSSTEIRNSKDTTCTEAGYTGDTYCTVCGELLQNGTEVQQLEHRFSEYEFNGEHHSKTCLDCGYHVEEEHQYTAEYEDDGKCHFKRCTVCAYIAKEEHTGGEATCTTKAVCDVCGKAYGEVNSSNHGKLELRNAKNPTCTETGYTGDKCCVDCNAIIQKGEEIKATGHTGGKATCISKAVCDTCKQEYGEFDKEYHVNIELRNAVETTGETGGYTGDVYCKDCEHVVKMGTAILPIEKEQNIEKLANKELVPEVKDTRNVKKHKETVTENKTSAAAVVTAGIGVTTVTGLGAVGIAKVKAAGSVAGKVAEIRKARTLKKINKMHGRH